MLIPSRYNSNMIYRGFGHRPNISTLELYVPSKNRAPVNTAVGVDEIVHKYVSYSNKDYPDRQRVVFGSTARQTAEDYGEVYFTFYPKSSDVWASNYSDTYIFLKEFGDSMKSLLLHFKIVKRHFDLNNVTLSSNYQKYLELMVELSEHPTIVNFAKESPRNIHMIINDMREFSRSLFRELKNYPQYKKWKNVVYNWMEDVANSSNNILGYFDNISKINDVDKASSNSELMIECNEYYVVNPTWFLDNRK